MTTEEIEESQEKFVEDVEQELRKRKREAKRKAKEAEREYKGPESGSLFMSPLVIGGKKKETYRSQKVEFKLDQELPDGTEKLDVSMPSESEIMDDGHELNRLLSLYGIETDQIADMSGERLPLVPVGEYDDPESVHYELDIPPVNKGMNMVKYKLRRILMRMKLIEKARTPYVATDIINKIEDINYDKPARNSKAPVMDRSLQDVFRTMYLLNFWDDQSERYVPTNRGMKLSISSIYIGLIAWYIATGSPLVMILSMIIISTVLAAFKSAHAFWLTNTFKYIKKKLFPKS